MMNIEPQSTQSFAEAATCRGEVNLKLCITPRTLRFKKDTTI